MAVATSRASDQRPALPPTEEYQAALTVSPSFERIDASVLLVISEVFSWARDRRAINGFFFLAHFLRLAQMKQLALFSGCDVAVISIKSVWDLCTNPIYGWPFSYEATSKYLRLLCAIGLFCKPPRRKGDPVVYHFPLRPYCMPASAPAAIAKLTRAHDEKIYKSLALRRVLPDPVERDHVSSRTRKIADSLPPELAHRLQVAAIAVRDALSEKGIVVPAAALQHISLAISQAFLSENSRFLSESPSSAFPRASRKKTGVDVLRTESAIGSRPPEHRQGADEHGYALESANFSQNLLSSSKIADSDRGGHTEFSISNKSSSSNTDITEFNGVQPLESASPTRQLGEADSSAHEGLDGFSIQHDAAELSYLFEKNDSSVGHYTKLLHQDHLMVRLAVIDAWMRSLWPDPGFKRMTLGGGWVTRQCNAYQAGKSVPAEFVAWAQTDYSYTQIKMVLASVDRCQQKTLRPMKRPLPSEVIVQAEEIADSSFWVCGAARGLEAQGYLYVDIEGDLMPISRYEQLRLQAIEQWSQELAEPVRTTSLVPDDLEHARQEAITQAMTEVDAYLAWVSPQMCRPKKISHACKLPRQLVDDIRCLEALLDPSYYQVRPYMIPLTDKPVIGVRGVQEKEPLWILRGPGEVQDFIAACEAPEENGGQAEESRSSDPEETALQPDHRPAKGCDLV